jgi:hypothetical protein
VVPLPSELPSLRVLSTTTTTTSAECPIGYRSASESECRAYADNTWPFTVVEGDRAECHTNGTSWTYVRGTASFPCDAHSCACVRDAPDGPRPDDILGAVLVSLGFVDLLLVAYIAYPTVVRTVARV